MRDSLFRACWVKVVYSKRAAEKEWRKNVDFQVLVDSRVAATGYDVWRYFISLALEQRDHPSQFIQLREVEARLRQAFARPSLTREKLNVATRLNDAAE